MCRFFLSVCLVALVTLPALSGPDTLGQKSRGFKIISIEKGSLYEKLGLQKGDILQSLGGQPIQSSQDFEKLANYLEPGQTHELLLIRNGSVKKPSYSIK